MSRILIVSLIAIVGCLTETQALALDTETRPVGPVRHWTVADGDFIDSSWLHVKFVEGADVTVDGLAFADATHDFQGLNGLLAAHGAVALRPTFRGTRAAWRAKQALAEARSGARGGDLSLWFDVQVAGGTQAMVSLVNALNALELVEIAHPSPRVRSALRRSQATVTTSFAGNTPDFTGSQDYLYAPPVGLDGPAAWATPGGTGEGFKFIDVELAWTEDHEDFDASRNFYIGGASQNPNYESHGTAVLGEVIGQHNGFGINGFAPDVEYGVVAITVAEWPLVPHRFQEAIDQLDAGDVWLIELQTQELLPMEYYQVNYDVIWAGVWSDGVVCVEAAANGSHDLDHSQWGGLFDRKVRDSGAILVGAGTPTGLVAEDFSNYGSRVDVHAWGSQIVTTGYGDLFDPAGLDRRYTAVFGGTSGASPMVTGAALCLQGVQRAVHGSVLDPVTLRAFLVDTGTPFNGSRFIGPRPDLGAAVQAVLATAAVTQVSPAPAAPVVLAAAPNPFRAPHQVTFTVRLAGPVELTLFDVHGRQVRRLHRGILAAGAHSFTWDGLNEQGSRAPTGQYYYRLNLGGEARTLGVLKLR